VWGARKEKIDKARCDSDEQKSQEEGKVSKSKERKKVKRKKELYA
jgi:hypothetical protein